MRVTLGFVEGRHDAGFAATSDAGNDFDDVFTMIEGSDFFEVFFSGIQFHVFSFDDDSIPDDLTFFQFNVADFLILSKVATLTAG